MKLFCPVQPSGHSRGGRPHHQCRPGPGLPSPPGRLVASPPAGSKRSQPQESCWQVLHGPRFLHPGKRFQRPAPSRFPPSPPAGRPRSLQAQVHPCTLRVDVSGGNSARPPGSQRMIGNAKQRKGSPAPVFPVGRPKPRASRFPRVAAHWQQDLKCALLPRAWARGWAARKLGLLVWKVGVMGAHPAEVRREQRPHTESHAAQWVLSIQSQR